MEYEDITFDQLWHLFLTVFPRLHSLVWNLPIRSNVLSSLNLDKKKSSSQPVCFSFLTLVSLHVKDVEMLRRAGLDNLLRFSVTIQESWKRDTFTFASLHSLNLGISKHLKGLFQINYTFFPVLKVLSITFLEPHTPFPQLDLPSLTEIEISTRLPTYNQGMEFLGLLFHQPQMCPRLEQIGLNSFLDLDLLYLLLRKRNQSQPEVSHINRLNLPRIPQKYHPTIAAMLAGCEFTSISELWIMMAHISIKNGQTDILNETMFVLFCILQAIY